MAPKTSQSSQGNQLPGKASQDGPSDEQRQQEASKTAQASLAAQQKAKELTQAAAGAGDPEERQRLLNEALQKEMEAGSLGKTAKYLTSGSFQGLVAGTGIGTGIGAGLGTLTAVLTGGLTSLITGGLGAGVGAAHGPFLKLGDVAGGAVRKLTGTIPGWESTPEQQEAIEKMLGQANDQERPSEHDLSAMTDPSKVKVSPADVSASADQDGHQQTWSEYASSYVPSKDSMPSLFSRSKDSEEGDQQQPKQDEAVGSQSGPGASQSDPAGVGKQRKSDSGSAQQKQPSQDKQSNTAATQGLKDATDGAQGTSSKTVSKTGRPIDESRRPKKLAPNSNGASQRRSTRSQTNLDASNSGSQRSAQPKGDSKAQARTQPPKLNRPSGEKPSSTQNSAEPPKKKPRKLEVRSGK